MGTPLVGWGLGPGVGGSFPHPSTCFVGLPLRLRVGAGGWLRIQKAWDRSPCLKGNPPGSPGRRVSLSLGPCRLGSLQAPPGASADSGTRSALGAEHEPASARRRGPGTGRVPLLGPLGLRPGLATNFAQVSCAGAAAPLSARSPRSVRPRVLRGRSPSGRASSARAERAEVQEAGCGGVVVVVVADEWVGFKEGAPSPQFAGPRWGCSQLPLSCSTVGPFPAQAASRRSRGDRSPVHGLRFRRAETPRRAAEFAHCLASATPGVVPAAPAGRSIGGRGSGILCPGGRRRARGREPHAVRRKRGRSPENAGDFS